MEKYGPAPQAYWQNALTAIRFPIHLDNCVLGNQVAPRRSEGAIKLRKRNIQKAKFDFLCGCLIMESFLPARSVWGKWIFQTRLSPTLPGISSYPLWSLWLEKLIPITASNDCRNNSGWSWNRVPATNYFKALRQRCDETGTCWFGWNPGLDLGRTG